MLGYGVDFGFRLYGLKLQRGVVHETTALDIEVNYIFCLRFEGFVFGV